MLLCVSYWGLPQGSKPAPTVSSLSDVMTTGWTALPRTWTEPPMRPWISSAVPVARISAWREVPWAAAGVRNFTTRLSSELLSTFSPP